MKQMLRYFGMGPFPAYVGIVWDEASFNKELKRLGMKDKVTFVEEGKSGALHSFHQDGELTCLIALDIKEARKRKLSQVLGLLVHEATHATQKIEEQMSNRSGLDAETEAYCIQWIAQCAFQHYLEVK